MCEANTKLLTLKEAAEFLNVSVSTMRRLVKNGKIDGTKVGGQWRFDKGYLLAKVYPTVLIVTDNGSPVRMLSNDTVEIDLKLEVKFDGERNVISVYDCGKHIGDFYHDEGWISEHHIKITYEKQQC
jgi:excisionase family DNA binding protein